MTRDRRSSAGFLFGKHTIVSPDGDPYMTRIWLGRLRFHIFHRGDLDQDCHDHPWDFWTFPLRSYVEEVLTESVHYGPVVVDRVAIDYNADGTPIYLDHFQTGPITTYSRRLQVVEAFHWHYRPATHKHRVLGAFTDWQQTGNPDYPYNNVPEYLPVGKIPTLVWHRKPSRKWGFTKEREGVWCWVPWKQYAYGGDKMAPCQPEDHK